MSSISPDADEVFAFGENWSRFLTTVDERRIDQATEDLARMLEHKRLDGVSFLDVGSGSGLSSLAARRLGARVSSFDADPASVACTIELRRRYEAHGGQWTVEHGSVLDRTYLSTLGTFDVVYSWGVLHHTGAMWDAMENVLDLVAPGGTLFIALYNDQGWWSRFWRALKRLYVRGPALLRPLPVAATLATVWLPRVVLDTLRGSPLRSWRAYRDDRGMSAWHDVIDWAGGYPFEVATPGDVHQFYRERGFTLERLVTRASGCNEFVFVRDDAAVQTGG